MGAPTPIRVQSPMGRRGSCRFHVRWTQTDSDNLTNEVVLDLDDLSSLFTDGGAQDKQHRYAVERVEWSSALGVSGDLEFDSMPPSDASHIMSITPEASSGEVSFAQFPSGCITEPNVLSPGDVVLTTRGALPNDELNLIVHYKEKGHSLLA